MICMIIAMLDLSWLFRPRRLKSRLCLVWPRVHAEECCHHSTCLALGSNPLCTVSVMHCLLQAAAAGGADGPDRAEAAALPGHPAQRRPCAPLAADRALQPQHVRLLPD